MVKKFETQVGGSAEAMTPSEEELKTRKISPESLEEDNEVVGKQPASGSLEDRELGVMIEDDELDGFDDVFDAMISDEERLKIAGEEGFDSAFEDAFGGIEEKVEDASKLNALGVSKNQLENLEDKQLISTVLDHVGRVRQYNNDYLHNMNSRMEALQKQPSDLTEEVKNAFHKELNVLKTSLEDNDKYINKQFAALDNELKLVDLRGMKMKEGKTHDKMADVFSESFVKGHRTANAEGLAVFNQNKKEWDQKIDILLEGLDKGEDLDFSEGDIMDLLGDLGELAQGGEVNNDLTTALSSEEMLGEGFVQAKNEFMSVKGKEEEWEANQDIIKSFTSKDLNYFNELHKSLAMIKLHKMDLSQGEGLGELSSEKVQTFLTENSYTMSEVDDSLKNIGALIGRYQEFNVEGSKINIYDVKHLEILKKLSELQ